MSIGSRFGLLLGELGMFPFFGSKSERLGNRNNSVRSVEVSPIVVGIESTGVFLAVVVFQRHVGCADCPRGRGDEGGVGASENGHFVVGVGGQGNQF